MGTSARRFDEQVLRLFVRQLDAMAHRSSTFRAMIAKPGELHMRSTVFSFFLLIFFPMEAFVKDPGRRPQEVRQRADFV
jgi:hypothetical protein